MATVLRAAIRTDGTTAPPTADLAMVRGQDRRYDVRVEGIPAGLTVTKLVWTGKLAPGDADSVKHFQKVLTSATALATIGRITDAGTAGVARATASFVPADSASWPDLLVHQLWAVLSDGKPYCCLTGELASIAPIPLALPAESSVDPDLPPRQQASLAWAFDPAYQGGAQTHPSRVGPAATLGSTSGADTNDPAHVATAPARYSFGADDVLDFGDSLDAVWLDPDGFTLMAAIEYVAASDIGFRSICTKVEAAPITFWMLLNAGKVRFVAYDGPGFDGQEITEANVALTNGRHVFTARYDRSQPRGNRTTLFVDGVAVASTPSVSGPASTLGENAGALRIGYTAGGSLAGLGVIANVYAWPDPLASADIADNDSWLRVTRGWG